MKYWRSVRISRVQSGWKVSGVLRTRVNQVNLVSELVAVVHVRVVVFGHHNPVGELASGESLHGFLTLHGGNVLHEDLQGDTWGRAGERLESLFDLENSTAKYGRGRY